MELTPQTIKSIRPGDARIEIKDGKYPLRLIVYPSGVKSFQFRCKVGGKSLRETLGQVGSMTLAQARTKALALKAEGGAPVAAKRVPKASPEETGLTMSEGFALYMQHEGDSRKSASEKWRIWEKDVEPTLGTRPLLAVTKRELVDCVKAKFDGGKGIASNAIQSLLKRFFNWCCREGWAHVNMDVNPMADVVKLAKPNVRERCLSPDELKWFFRALPSANGFGPIFELILRTATRRSDIFELAWGEVKGEFLDLDETKNGFAFMVAMPPSAQALIPAKPAKAKAADAVFAHGADSSSSPMRRLRAKMQEFATEEGEEIPHWSLHDFRRTVRTYLEGLLDENYRQLVPPHISERILAHKDTTIAKHYNKHEYLAAKREALRLWNEYLDGIRDKALVV